MKKKLNANFGTLATYYFSYLNLTLAGQERFKSLIPTSLQDSKCIFIIYDITQENALTKAQQWLDLVQTNCDNSPNIYLIGNKTDLTELRKISYQDGLNFANKNQLQFQEISAKTGKEDIDKIFNEIFREIYCKEEFTKTQEEQQVCLEQDNQFDVYKSDKSEKQVEEEEEQKLDESNQQALSHVTIYSENSKEPFLTLAIKPGSNLKLFIKSKEEGQKNIEEIQEKYEIQFQITKQ